MTCPHCEELREEIRFLKRQIDIETSSNQVDRLASAFKVSPGTAQILSALYNARGRILSRVALDEAAPAVNVSADDRDLKIIDVRICRLRKAMSAAAIENVWGRGYFLTDIGRLMVDEAMERHGEAA